MNSTARHGYRQHQILLQRELGQWAAGLEHTLTPLHQRIVHTLDWLNLDSLIGYKGTRAGPPERSRVALAQAFVAKAILGFEQTTQLRSRLAVDTVLRRLLGFESYRALPSEATFSRAFAEFARTGLPAKAHEALIRQHLGSTVIGHIARDSTAIQARERAQHSTPETVALNEAKAAKLAKTAKADKQPKRRGRPPGGSAESVKTKPRIRIPAQLLQTPRRGACGATPAVQQRQEAQCAGTLQHLGGIQTASGCGLLRRAHHRSLDFSKRVRQPSQRAAGAPVSPARHQPVYADGCGLRQ